MNPSNFWSVRAMNASGSSRTTRDDTPIMIRMRYVGTGTVTSVTVTTATNIVMITSDGGTDTYAFATYDTVGKLIAAINADGIFQAMAVDALLTDVTSSSNIVENTAITAGTDDNGVVCYDLHTDTSVTDYATVALTFNRNFDTLSKGHRVHAQELAYYENVSAAAANAVRLYQRLPSGVETQIWGIASVDATITTKTWASGQGKITGQDGAALIFRVQDATSITDDTSNFVQITGILE